MSREPDIMQIVIANINYYKAITGLKDCDIQTRAQIGRSTFSDRMNRHGRAFDIDELRRIAKVLKVSIIDLITRK